MTTRKTTVIHPQVTVRPPAASEWTWAYRAMLGTLSTITIGLVSYLGLGIMENQRQMGRDIFDLKTDLSVQIAGMQSNIGTSAGKIQMMQERENNMGIIINKSAQDIAVLQSRLNDLQGKPPQ